MFWSKKKDSSQSVVQVAESVIEKYRVTPMHTVDIINASKINYVDLLDKDRTPEEEHLRKYLHTLKRREAEDNKAEFDVRFIDWAKKAGFNLFVSPDVVSQFKYAALVCDLSSPRDSYVIDGGREVIYVGDIPDFALDRIKKAHEATCETLFTIHSNQELPVKYQAFVYRDPVIILWNTNSRVSIEKKKGVWKGSCDSSFHTLDIGCVVAMWQDDGEPL
jgi:hypothetical protein